MTIEEINALEAIDVLEILEDRLDANGVERLNGEFYSSQQLSDEFAIYKANLIAMETERLREQDLKDRFAGLTDMRMAFHALFIESNPERWLLDIIDGDPVAAEAAMVSLEAMDVEQDAVRVENATRKAIDAELENIKFGQRLLAKITIGNKAKSLTKQQRKQMSIDFSQIQALLGSGSLDLARDEIAVIVPDGTAITQADIDGLLSDIDAYLA